MNIKIQEKEGKANMKIVGTYITSDMFDELQKEADDSFTSISSIVRKILYKYISTKNKQ